MLATGGGAVLRAGEPRRLAERGCVVYLETSVAQQVNRVQPQPEPAAAAITWTPREKLEQLMRERAPLYAEIADFTVATDGRRVRSVAEQIARMTSARRSGHPES